MTVHDGEEKVFTTPRETSAPKREGQENKSLISEILVYLIPALSIFGATIGLYGIASKYFVGFSNQMGSDFVTVAIIGGSTFAIGWVTYLFREKNACGTRCLRLRWLRLRLL